MNKVWVVWCSQLGEEHFLAGIFSNETIANKIVTQLIESEDNTAFSEEWVVDDGI